MKYIISFRQLKRNCVRKARMDKRYQCWQLNEWRSCTEKNCPILKNCKKVDK